MKILIATTLLLAFYMSAHAAAPIDWGKQVTLMNNATEQVKKLKRKALRKELRQALATMTKNTPMPIDDITRLTSTYMVGDMAFYQYDVDLSEYGTSPEFITGMHSLMLEHNVAKNCTHPAVRFMIDNVNISIIHLYSNFNTGELLFQVQVIDTDCNRFKLPY